MEKINLESLIIQMVKVQKSYTELYDHSGFIAINGKTIQVKPNLFFQIVNYYYNETVAKERIRIDTINIDSVHLSIATPENITFITVMRE
jgi:hypothetical protein